MPDVTFFDMFAGIGGFRSGLERAGGFRCIGHCEIDPHADKSYRAIHKINPKEVSIKTLRTSTQTKCRTSTSSVPVSRAEFLYRREAQRLRGCKRHSLL